MLRSRRVKTTTPIEKHAATISSRRSSTARQEAEASPTNRAAATRGTTRRTFEGVINNLQRRYNETTSDYVKEDIEKYMSASTCKVCNGARLKPEALAVTIAGKNINDDHDDVGRARRGSSSASFAPTERETLIAHQILKEIRARLGFLDQRRPRLPEPRAFGDDALGRRIAAHSPGDADRLVAGRRALHPRRTVDRPASARQRPAAGDAEDAARHRQHADRDRARRGHDARGRRDRRHRAGRRRRGRRHPLGRADRRDPRRIPSR